MDPDKFTVAVLSSLLLLLANISMLIASMLAQAQCYLATFFSVLASSFFSAIAIWGISLIGGDR